MTNTNTNFNLEIGEKYTIWNNEGFTPYTANFTLIDYKIYNFAQHKNSLQLLVRFKKHRSNDIVTLSYSDEAVILKGWHKIEAVHKIKISENMTSRKKRNITEFENNKDMAMYKPYGTLFTANDNYEGFVDYTGDYLCYNNIKGIEQITNESYLNYVKDLLRDKKYNVSELKSYIKAEGYNCLYDSLEAVEF